MDLNFDDITYSDYDIKRKIKIPKKLTPLLAEDLGFHIGDGCMLMYTRNDNGRMRYYFNYSGNADKDLDYFQNKLFPRKKELYNLEIKIKKSSSSNSIHVDFHSRALFDFFLNLGIPHGEKGQVGIPKLIQESNNAIKLAFLRGLAAADFCVAVKNRCNGIYPTINTGISSERLRDEICDILDELGIPFTKYNGCRIDPRYNSLIKSYSIDINGRKRLKLWMERIGFSDKRNLTAAMKFF